jgi:elongation factor P
MDTETYDMYELSEEQVGFTKYFLTEGMEVNLLFFEGDLLTLSVPEKVEVTIAETAPAIKGAPSNQTKDAVTDTGLKILVPQFIAEGEKVVVYTADGKYAGRA